MYVGVGAVVAVAGMSVGVGREGVLEGILVGKSAEGPKNVGVTLASGFGVMVSLGIVGSAGAGPAQEVRRKQKTKKVDRLRTETAIFSSTARPGEG